MTEPIEPIEETEEYAAAVEDDAPLAALGPVHQEDGTAGAVTAARAYAAAVQATVAFVVDLAGPPTDEDLARYATLQERENVAWQRRREAFAVIGLRHDLPADDGAW